MARRNYNPPGRQHGGIAFRGTLQGTSCVKFDGEGSGKITFTFPQSEMRRVADLMQQHHERDMVIVALPYTGDIDPNNEQQ